MEPAKELLIPKLGFGRIGLQKISDRIFLYVLTLKKKAKAALYVGLTRARWSQEYLETVSGDDYLSTWRCTIGRSAP